MSSIFLLKISVFYGVTVCVGASPRWKADFSDSRCVPAETGPKQFATAAEQMLLEQTITGEGCLALQRACNSASGGRLLARTLSNLGLTQKPSE